MDDHINNKKDVGESIIRLKTALLSPYDTAPYLYDKLLKLSASIWLNKKFGIVTRNDLKQSYPSVEYYGSASVEIDTPTNSINYDPQYLLKHKKIYHMRSPFVSEVSNVDIIGPTGVPVKSGNIILESFCGRKHKMESYICEESAKYLAKYNYNKIIPKKELNLVCSLTPIRYAYCDWITCVLTKIIGLKKYIKETGKEPTLLIRPDPPNWALQFLHLAGIPKDNIVQWDGTAIKANNYIVPTTGTLEYAPKSIFTDISPDDDFLRFPHPAVSKDLKQRMIESAKQEAPEQFYREKPRDKVYISRQLAECRMVDNIDEVKNLLKPKGFKFYDLEELDPWEQILLISNAETIVSPHGAGLANIIFSDDLNIIEMFGEKKCATYYLLANSLEHNYSCIGCKQITDKKISVDIGLLQEII